MVDKFQNELDFQKGFSLLGEPNWCY